MTTIHLTTEVINVKETFNELRDAIRLVPFPDISVTEINTYHGELSGKTWSTETPTLIMKNNIVKISDHENRIET